MGEKLMALLGLEGGLQHQYLHHLPAVTALTCWCTTGPKEPLTADCHRVLVVQALHMACCLMHPLCNGLVGAVLQLVAGLVADVPGVDAGMVPVEQRQGVGRKEEVTAMPASWYSVHCLMLPEWHAKTKTPICAGLVLADCQKPCTQDKLLRL